MKIVYIAHPISGNVVGNITRIELILQRILETRNGIYPIAPYIPACKYLDDNSTFDRSMAFEANKLFFTRHFLDELWVCGALSSGVLEEMRWAIDAGNIKLRRKEKDFEDIPL